MPATTLTNHGNLSVYREGTSAMTITGTRDGADVIVDMEFDVASREECIAMVSMLLVQLERLHGQNLTAQCIAHYAREAEKMPQSVERLAFTGKAMIP